MSMFGKYLKSLDAKTDKRHPTSDLFQLNNKFNTIKQFN